MKKNSLTELRKDLDHVLKQMTELRRFISRHEEQYDELVRQRRLLNERISLRERGVE